jgi:hypothetical protein
VLVRPGSPHTPTAHRTKGLGQRTHPIPHPCVGVHTPTQASFVQVRWRVGLTWGQEWVWGPRCGVPRGSLRIVILHRVDAAARQHGAAPTSYYHAGSVPTAQLRTTSCRAWPATAKNQPAPFHGVRPPVLRPSHRSLGGFRGCRLHRLKGEGLRRQLLTRSHLGSVVGGTVVVSGAGISARTVAGLRDADAGYVGEQRSQGMATAAPSQHRERSSGERSPCERSLQRLTAAPRTGPVGKGAHRRSPSEPFCSWSSMRGPAVHGEHASLRRHHFNLDGRLA